MKMNESLEDSFQLLSTMSPKVRHKKLAKKKAPTKLTLRKPMRKSSLYDRLPITIQNKNVQAVENSSTESTSSDSTEGRLPAGLSTSKYVQIKIWLDNIEIYESDDENITILSQVSSIQGDYKTSKNVASSTFINSQDNKLVEDFFKVPIPRKMSDCIDTKENFTQLLINKYCNTHSNVEKDSLSNRSIISDSAGDKSIIEDSEEECNDNLDKANHLLQKYNVKTVTPQNRKKSPNTQKMSSKNWEETCKKKEDDKKKRGCDKSSGASTDYKKGLDEEVNVNNTTNRREPSETLNDCDNFIVDSEEEEEQINNKGKNFSKINDKQVESYEVNSSTSEGSIIEETDDDNCSNNVGDVPPGNNINDGCDVIFIDDSMVENKENIDDNRQDLTPKNKGSEDEYEQILDDLYGDSWRPKRDLILSERKPKKKERRINRQLPKTDIKPKISIIHKNPYLETETGKSNNLLRTLQTARMKVAMESPWRSALKSLCDPESDDSPVRTNNFNILQTRTKLNFNDDDECSSNDKTGRMDKKAKENNSILLNNDRKEVNRKNEDNGFINDGSVSSDSSFDIRPVLEERVKDKKIKITKPIKKKAIRRDSTSSSNSDLKLQDIESNFKRIEITPKKSLKSLTFLDSLSKNVPDVQADASARIFRNCYKDYKQQLLEKLFKLFNMEIFDNAIPEDTPFEWSTRLRGTAGYCACRTITHSNGSIERKIRIVLSEKVLDSADRLRDTLVHELCHAANWVVNKISDGHGPQWQSWAARAMKRFPELPIIKRCHDYAINTKYTYKCTQCGYSFGRHSKSLNLEKKRCGYCLGKFEVLLNKTNKNGETKSVLTPKKKPTAFALFVKENYATYKKPNVKHGEVMKILGQKFKEFKANKL